MKEMTRTANRTATINHGKNEHSAQQIEQTVPTAPTTPTASTTSTASTAPTVINTKGGSGGIVTDSPLSLSISIPLAGHTLRSATNLFNLMYTWGSLISSATGGSFKVDKYFINVINRRKFESIDELMAYARTETEIHRVLTGMKIGRDKITFDGFLNDGFKEANVPENCGLYSRLIVNMNSAAMKTKVIQVKMLSDVETEQWQSFSKWLRRIGMTNEDRLALLDLLSERTIARPDFNSQSRVPRVVSVPSVPSSSSSLRVASSSRVQQIQQSQQRFFKFIKSN